MRCEISILIRSAQTNDLTETGLNVLVPQVHTIHKRALKTLSVFIKKMFVNTRFYVIYS